LDSRDLQKAGEEVLLEKINRIFDEVTRENNKAESDDSHSSNFAS
jgi:hypothetical protein